MKQPRAAMGYPRWRNRFPLLLAARPRWSCPCPSFPPPKRSRRGDRRSPTPEKVQVPRHLLQITHLLQRLGHLRQPLRLLPQKGKKLRRLRQYVGMLCGEQFQLRLHQCQRCAQLVGGVPGELPLGGKGVVQPLQHLIEGMAELAELRQYVLADLHVC